MTEQIERYDQTVFLGIIFISILGVICMVLALAFFRCCVSKKAKKEALSHFIVEMFAIIGCVYVICLFVNAVMNAFVFSRVRNKKLSWLHIYPLDRAIWMLARIYFDLSTEDRAF